MDKKKLGKVLGICIAIVLLAVMCFTFFVTNTFNIKKNIELANVNSSENTNAQTNAGEKVARINTSDGEFNIDAVDIIKKASELLGEEYCQNNSKGVNGQSPWTHIVTAKNIMSAQEVKDYYVRGADGIDYHGIDCSGLVYWTLSSIAREKYNNDFGTKSGTWGSANGTSSNASSGFTLNNPVPLDTVHWLTYWDGYYANYWREVGVGGARSAYDAGLKMFGRPINILKAEEIIYKDYRYYDYKYKDENGETRAATLPAGTIVIANAKAHNNNSVNLSYHLDDHMWITLGDLGTTNVEEAIRRLQGMGILEDKTIEELKNSGNIYSYDNGCTYWRIESAAGVGVQINNGDPDFQHTEIDPVTGEAKEIGPIWAFQIANPIKIEGNYNISVEKTDANGNKINLNNKNIFDVKLHAEQDTDLKVKNISENRVNYESLDINSKKDDYITIVEKESLTGYDKYNRKIELRIDKTTYDSNSRKFIGKIAGVKIGDINASFSDITETPVENGKFTSSDGLVTVSTEADNTITVTVKNPTIDLALKKVITKVDTVDASGNVTGSTQVKRKNDTSWYDITPLKENKTDALYSMNKTPIEVKKGDVVSYRLYVFNEGQVNAKALDISDYIPVGLEVTNVYYKDDTALNKVTTKDGLSGFVNGYFYNKDKGVLNIHLGQAGLINKFDGNNLANDYVTVKCKVASTADGILTNMAEISTYATENGTVDRDIDSIKDNWKSPNKDNKEDSDKSTSNWRNYKKGDGSVDDNEYHTNFTGSKYNETTGQEDDDDFEKVRVVDEYQLELVKVSNSDKNKTIPEIEFKIESEVQPLGKITNPCKTDGKGKINFGRYPIKQANIDKEDVYTITETKDENGKYYQLVNPITLKVKKKKANNGHYVIDKIALNNSSFVSEKQLSEVEVELANTTKKVKVSASFTGNKITITVPNIEKDGQYTLNVNKVKTDGTNLSGAEFNIVSAEKKAGSSWSNLGMSGSNGRLSTTKPIAVTSSNRGTIDLIQISETTAPTGYEKFDKKVILQISKNNNYVIDSVGILVVDNKTEYSPSNVPNASTVINSANKVYEDSTNGFKIELGDNNTTINFTLVNKKVDLALKKNITKVNGTVVSTQNGYSADRIMSQDEISSKKLDGNYVNIDSLKSSTNATYWMDKTPVGVSIGDTVEYAIKIFNEGEVNAKASKINDYIPQGLTVTAVSYRGKSLPFSVSKYGVLSINLGSQDEFISAFNGTTLSYDQVIVTCEVNDRAFGILTNVAEITEYATAKGVIERDIDSSSDNWKSPDGNKLSTVKNSSLWRNYGSRSDEYDNKYKDDYLAQDSGLNRNHGDDDDFDKLVVNNIDLALKKVITKVETVENGKVTGTTEINRPKTNDTSWYGNGNGSINPRGDVSPLNNGKTDALYSMNKTPIEVKRGNIVTYRLYVFNEGQTNAKALDITDYIPVGLKVQDVYYKDSSAMSVVNINDYNDTTRNNKKGENYYSYDEKNGTVYVHLGSANLINKFNGSSLANDYITVKCVVEDSAKGVLTNMAEISTYATQNAELGTDVDSYSNNWKSPNNDGKVQSDKSTSNWRNYVRGTGKLDDNYYTAFTGSKHNSNSGQEDDDDFEKVKVVDDFSIEILKVTDGDKPIGGIPFHLKENERHDDKKCTINDVKFTGDDGRTNIIKKEVKYNSSLNGEYVYYIKELKASDDSIYQIIDTEFELRIKIEKSEITGGDEVAGYYFGKVGSGVKYKDLSEDTTVPVTDKDGNKVRVQASYDSESRRFTIEISNNIKDSSYDMQLIKVSDKKDSSGKEETISGIKFAIDGGDPITTNSKGIINFGTYDIKMSDYETPDVHEIVEVTDDLDRYYQLKNPIRIRVKKDRDGSHYFIKGIALNDENYSDKKIEKEVELKNTNKKVKISAYFEGNKITVKVPNIEKDGEYRLIVEKKKPDGNVMTDLQTGFSLKDINEQEFTESGRVTLANKKITADTYNTPEEYTITETTAPDGYVKLAEPIKLKVYKEDGGDNLKLSKVEASIGANGNVTTIPDGGKQTLKGAKLEDGTTVDITIDLQNKNEILVSVPNNPINGKYNFIIYKYAMENGKEVPVPDILFWVERTDSILKSPRTTNKDGLAGITGIKITKSETVNYTIREQPSSDSKYIPIDGKIKVQAITNKSSDGTKYILEDANFENGTKKTKATLKNGKEVDIKLEVIPGADGVNTIKVSIENPPIKGKYLLDLVKVKDLGNNASEPIKGVTFGVDKVEQTGTETNRTPIPTQATLDDGVTKIAEENITYENVAKSDVYEVHEIGFEETNKYIKLKEPLRLEIVKGKNKKGEEGTDNAPGTRFIATHVIAVGQGTNSVKSQILRIEEGETTATLKDIALEDGSVVDIKIDATEEIENLTEQKVQRIKITIPNREIKGDYSVRIRKVDEKGNALPNAEFKYESTVNNENRGTQTTARTDGDGYTNLTSVTLNSETIKSEDTYTISEVKIYKDATSTIEETGYSKLSQPITLTVIKDTVNNAFVIKGMRLSQNGETAESSGNKVTLQNVQLENGKTATVDAILGNNGVITLTIPNHEIDGSYSLELVKTTDDYSTTVGNVQFKYTGNEAGSKTNSEGKISLGTTNITKDTVNEIDEFKIREVEGKNNNIVELKDEIIINVEKEKLGGSFAVKKVTITSGGKSKEIISDGSANVIDFVELTDLETVNPSKKAKVRLILNKVTQLITINVDNPKPDGEISMKIKKVDANTELPLSDVEFNVQKKEIVTTGHGYEVTKEFTSVSQSDGYAYILGDNPFTADITETKEKISNKPIVWSITEAKTKSGYKLLDKVRIDVNVVTKLSEDGRKYIINSNATNASVVRLEETKEAIEQQNEIQKRLQFVVSPDGTSMSFVIANTPITGKYSLRLKKVDTKGNDVTTGIPFTVTKNGEEIIKNLKTSNSGSLSLYSHDITRNGQVDTFVIKEEELNGSKYIKLAEDITVRVTSVLNSEGTDYILGSVTFDNNETEKEVRLENGKTATATIEKNDKTRSIIIKVPNDELEGKYSLRLRKVSKDAGVEGVVFTVKDEQAESTNPDDNVEQLAPTGSDGYVTYFEDKPITSDLKEDKYTIDEIVDTNKYIKLKSPITLTVKKGSNESKYYVAGMKLEGMGPSATIWAEGEKSAILNGVALSNSEDVVTVKATLDTDTNTISLEVPNDSTSGSYSFEIRKVNSENSTQGIKNIKFNIDARINGEMQSFTTDATGDNGFVNVKDITLDGNKLGTDSYTINEVIDENEDSSYIKLLSSISLEVKKTVENGKVIISGIRLYQGDNMTEYGTSAILSHVRLEDDTEVNIAASVSPVNNKITLLIPNKCMSGKYNVKIVKYDEDFTNKLGQAQIDYSINGEKQPRGVTTDVIDGEGGEIVLPEYTITKQNYRTLDKYVITEYKAPNDKYLKLVEPIELRVEKVQEGNKYVVGDIRLICGSNNVVAQKQLGENEVTLSGVRTTDSNITADVKARIDRNTQSIEVMIENPTPKGSYKLNIKKVDSTNPSEVLSGVKFNASYNGSIFKSGVTTRSDGIAYIAGDDPETTIKEEEFKIEHAGQNQWVITEESTIDGYILNDDCQVVLDVETGFSSKEGEGRYVVKKATAHVEPKSGVGTYDAKQLEMVRDGLNATVSEDGTEITVTIPNEGTIDYNFKMIKTDDNGNGLEGAKFTVVGPDGTVILNEEELPDKTYLVKSYEKVRKNETYKFTISENSTPSRYMNLLKGFKLEVYAKIDSSGNIDINNSRIEIKPEAGNYDSFAYTRLRMSIASGKTGITKEADNTIAVKIENPLITASYELELLKAEIGETQSLPGAEFTVNKNGSKLKDFTTDGENATMIDQVGSVEAGTEITYLVEETKAPANYTGHIRTAKVIVSVDNNGNVNARIDEVGSVSGGVLNTVKYDEETYKDIVTLGREEGTNKFTIKWHNSGRFVLRLFKKNYEKRLVGKDYSGDLIESLPGLPGAHIQISENGNILEPDYTTEGNVPLIRPINDVKANSEYVYTISELSTVDGYTNHFAGVNLIVHLRTDDNAKLIPINKYNTSQHYTQLYSYYELKDTTGTKTKQQMADLMSMVKVVIDSEDDRNFADIYLVNKKPVEPDYYMLNLWKTNKKGDESLKGAEFEVAVAKTVVEDGREVTKPKVQLDSDTTTSETDNFVTDENGIVVVGDTSDKEGIKFTPGVDKYHTFTIKEVKAPKGYLELKDVEIQVTVNLEGKSSYRDIKPADVRVSINGTTNLDITASVDQDSKITLNIPNDGNSFIVSLKKTDMAGNVITSSTNEKGKKQGTRMAFTAVSDGAWILHPSQLFDTGEVKYIENVAKYGVNTYFFKVREVAPKPGYMNILEDYDINVYAVLDEDGRVTDVNPDNPTEGPGTHYTISKVRDNTDVSIDEAKEYVKLHVEDFVNESGDVIRNVVIEVLNPIEYKVRVQKTDTDNKPINKAVISGTVTKNGSTTEEIKLDKVSIGTSKGISIKEGETQEWVIDEISVDSPYANILNGNKKLYIKAWVEKQQLKYDYAVHDIVDGNEVILGKTDDIYKCININLNKVNGENVFDVKIENPTGVNFVLIKTDINGNAINSAMVQVETEKGKVTTNANGSSYNSRIDVNQNDVRIGEVKSFIISELKAEAPYVNVLGNNKLFVKLITFDGIKVEVCGKGYIDENNVEHYGDFGPFESYVELGNVTVNRDTGIPTLVVKLKNPMRYIIDLDKVDENGNPLQNADLVIVTPSGEVKHNNGAAGIEYNDVVTPDNVNGTITVREIKSAYGYNNNLLNKQISFKVSATNGNLGIREVFVRDTSTGEIHTGIDSIKDYFSYKLIPASETETGIPVVKITMKNTTDYNLNIVKQTTKGTDYDGAILSLYEVDPETKEETIIKTNISSAKPDIILNPNITEEDISVLPNATYTYVIKEVSTRAPYVNILGDGKKIVLTVRLNKNEETGELTLEHHYDICDKDGNILENDVAREFISFNPQQDETTGKYTLNMYVQNPTKFKMKFDKVDDSDFSKSILDKATILINDKKYNGEVQEFTNLKFGDKVTFVIKETAVKAPFVNILGENRYIRLTAQVGENGRIHLTEAIVPENIREYFSYNIVQPGDSEGGVPQLNMELKNPISYKIKLTKQDMAGFGLAGADIVVNAQGKEYRMDKDSSELEILMNDIKPLQVHEISIREVAAKENYKNVFEGKTLLVGLIVDDTEYKLHHTYTKLVGRGQNEIIEDNKYLNTPNGEVDIATSTFDIVMKNPIEYDLQVIKTDLSGNEINGDGLEIHLTKKVDDPDSEDEVVENNGKSTIEFKERDLAPNTVNTYEIEELSTIAPHVNKLENKKLTVEIRVDENGKLIVQKFEVIDKTTGEVLGKYYVDYDDSAFSGDGTRLINIYIRNPIEYIFDLTKVDMSGNEIAPAIIQVNKITNLDNSTNPATITPKVHFTEEDVEIDTTIRYEISESQTKLPYVNVLENKKLFIEVYVDRYGKLHISDQGYIDESGNDISGYGSLSKYVEQARILYSEETGLETIEIKLKNPMMYKFKLYKVDGNGKPLPNADIEVVKDGTIYYNNGSDKIEEIFIEDKGRTEFTIREIGTAYGYNNDLQNKEIRFNMANSKGYLATTYEQYANVGQGTWGAIGELKDYFVKTVKQANETEDGVPVIEITMKNTTDYNLNIIKHTTQGVEYNGAELELYEVDSETKEEKLIRNNIVKDEKQANITENNIHALPNKTYTYVIKELSTTNPYVNILENGKKVILTVRLNKNEETGELTFEYNYDICDKDGNVLENDVARELISFDPQQDESTGKYTLNMYIQNPTKFRMKFDKVDRSNKGNSILDKATILINGDKYTGKVQEFTNLKVGDKVEFVIRETEVKAPFVNVLGETGYIKVVVRVDNDGRIHIAETTSNKYDFRDYFSYDIIQPEDSEDGVPQLNMKLENPISYKIKLTKQDMAGFGLAGADIAVNAQGKEYRMDKDSSELEISMNDIKPMQIHEISIREVSAKENYKNVFEGKTLFVGLLVDDTEYKLHRTYTKLVGRGQNEIINDNKYLNTPNGEVDIAKSTFDIVMKNPIEYDLQVIKTDLSGNEIEGDGLEIHLTKKVDDPDSEDEVVENNGKSTIEFKERDLAPNTVNTYEIEELSTIAPHVNKLENKRLTVEIRVDENGKIVVQKFEVTDKTTGENLGRYYVDYDENAFSNDGTRLIKIYVRNPLQYKLKLIKTRVKNNANRANGSMPEELQGASIQVNDISNENGSSQINMVVDDVKIGEMKTFVISENSTTVSHDNLLKDYDIVLRVTMESNRKLKFVSQQLRHKLSHKNIEINEDIKEKYRFDYEFITGDDGYETLQVHIENPIKFNVKLVKTDATGITELSGTDIELYSGNNLVATNKETGNAVLEYTQNDVIRDGIYTFKVRENASVSPNQNILNGKELIIVVRMNSNEILEVLSVRERKIGESETSYASEFITVTSANIDGIETLEIGIENPMDFDVDLVKNAAGIGFLQNTRFQVYREGVQEAIFDGNVTDINTWKTSEITEHNMKAGRYTYYITETKTARPRYINILENKYVKVNIEVSGTGQVKVMNNNWEESPNYYEVYEGDVANRKESDKLVDRQDLIYDDITVDVLVNNVTNKYMLQCNITNPIKYVVEIEKLDSVEQSLIGAKFELVSQIIKEQNAQKTETDKFVGVNNVNADGTVSGVTTENTDNKAVISYEETYVKVGTYEYTLKEIETPGKQYVNPFEGYTIHFKVSVNRDGDINLELYDNGKNCYIEKDGVEAAEKLYEYVFLDEFNSRIVAKLGIKVENPVRYTVILDKDIYGEDNIKLSGTKFKIESDVMKSQKAAYRQISKEKGVDDVTEEGIISATTDSNGNVVFEETMVDAGIYEYWISEVESGNKNIINALQDMYIKVYLKVDSDGTIHTVTSEGQITENKFYLYDSTKENLIDFDTTSVDELINIETSDENEVNTVRISIDNPQPYDLNLIKTDIDTKENMNDVLFEIKTYKENESGEPEEIQLRKAYDNTQSYSTKELLTNTIESVDGVISIKDILFEATGTYYFEFIETTPQKPIIYKDKAENVKVKVEIAIEEIDGQEQYVISNMEVVQGEKYTIADNTKHTNNTIDVNITNERIKGSYDLEMIKLEELLGKPVQGAKFTIKAFKQNVETGAEEEINLYKSTDDVKSMDVIIPDEFTIDDKDGIFRIEDIRIERPETYVLEIKETAAPDTYTILRDPIRLKVTTKITGEYDNAKYVLDTVELDGSDNDGLVVFKHTEDEIVVDITNNQFDLSLRKFISSINGEDVTRWSEPDVDTSKLITGEETTAEYYNSKLPLRVYAGQEIIYTLRVYNEGQIDGYVNKIVDHLPEQLEFLANDKFNIARGWEYVKEDTSLRTIQTDYLSKDRNAEKNLIKAFDPDSGELDYVEVQVKCRIKDDAKVKTYVTNIAEITEYEGKDRPNVVDRDNSKLVKLPPTDEDLEKYKDDEITNKYVPGQEDDDDFEKVIVEEFDLALRKFITRINDGKVTSRIPVFKVDQNGNYIYEQDKTPLIVAHQNIVEYSIRVFNEGTVSGYANLVKDNIPEGLVFVPYDEVNKKYGWKMLDVDGNETSDVTKAKFVVTDYLSMENGEKTDEFKATGKNPYLINAFDSKTMEQPDNRDLKVVFKVNVPNRRDDVIINEAQITDDTDENGTPVRDKDSTTNVWIPGEDDQDVEYIKVKYFDLALYKWVTDAIVTENGKTTNYPSNHSQSDKSNVVNVSIPKDKVNDVTVKFKYTVKVENQGNLEGYAKEIKDHIPAGLKFVAGDNTQYGWVEQPDGTITNDCFKDTLLKEGDTAEVTVILTWINGTNNLGQKINYAEISKDENKYGVPDIDSVPNNFNDIPREDDEDGDVVLLNIRTGVPAQTYMFIGIAVLVIVVAGIVGIKKFVLRKE